MEKSGIIASPGTQEWQIKPRPTAGIMAADVPKHLTALMIPLSKEASNTPLADVDNSDVVEKQALASLEADDISVTPISKPPFITGEMNIP